MSLLAGWWGTYGGDLEEYGNYILKTTDGNYLLAGSTESFGPVYGKSAAWLMKIDSSGDTLWTRSFPMDSETVTTAKMILEEEDSGYVFIGDGDRGSILVRTNKDGDTLWTRRYGSSLDLTWPNYIEKTGDGGYAITGRAYLSDYNYYLWILKTDSCGDSLWAKLYAGDDFSGNCGKYIFETDDGGYVVLGEIGEITDKSETNIWFLRTDSLGDTLWTRIIGRENGSYDVVYSVCPDEDGGYTIFASLDSVTCFLKMDFMGNVVFEKKYEPLFAIRATSFKTLPGDKGYVLCGYLRESFIMKVDTAGEEIGINYFPGPSNDYLNSLELTENAGFIAVGSTSSWGAGMSDIWIVCIDSLGDTLGVYEPSSPVTHPPSPVTPVTPRLEISSPINSEITLRYSLNLSERGTLKLFDASGRMVSSICVHGQGEVKVAALTPGVYFARLEAEGLRVTQKVVILR